MDRSPLWGISFELSVLLHRGLIDILWDCSFISKVVLGLSVYGQIVLKLMLSWRFKLLFLEISTGEECRVS